MMDSSHSFKVVASAPAKVILFGEHSVVYGTPAISTTISRNTTVVVSFNSDKALKINFEKLEATCTFVLPLENPIIPSSLTTQQKQAVDCCLLIVKNLKCGENGEGLSVNASSDFTLGAGLGSSASFSVSLAAAILVNNMTIKGEHPFQENGTIHDDVLKKVKELSHECEKVFHGNPSGIDTATCTMGGIVRFQKGKELEKIADSFPMKIAVVHSGVERQTSKLVERVRKLKERFPGPVDSIIQTIGMIVEAAAQEIRTPTCDSKLLDLVRMNHGLLSSLGVSHPVLEKIALSVSDIPVGFKLTGAGGGGNALIFVPNHVDIEKFKQLLDDSNFDFTIVDVGVKGLDVKILQD